MDGLMRVFVALSLGWCYGFAPNFWVVSSLGVFILLHHQSFMRSLLIALSFYVVSMIPVALVSFDYSGSLLVAASAYLLVTVFSSALMAFCFYGESNPASSFMKLLLFFFIFLVPPFSIWSFSSPLWLAGAIFPSYGFLGLGLFASLVYVLRYRPAWGVVALAGFSLLSLSSVSAGRIDAVGVKTYKNMESRHVLTDVYRSHVDDIKLASQQNGKVVYFPEDNFGVWNKEIGGLLQDKSLSVVGGAKLYSRNESVGGLNKYAHVVVDLGRNEIVYRQRELPPKVFDPYLSFSKSKNSGVVVVDRSRVGMFICWESIHIPTVISTLSNRPDYVVLFSNTYTSKRYPAGRFLVRHLKLWSDLFDVPFVFSVNGYV